jgi:cytochrome c peroxidase
MSLLLFIIMASAFMYTPPHKLTYLKLFIPKGWPKPPTNIFAANPLTEEGFTLGKKLFYDGRLSRDGNFPCSSCHQQFSAFSTYAHDFSHGFNNGLTKRNAPGLFNLAWQKEMHWDGGINNIEVQPLAPLTDLNEMAETLPNVLQKLKADTAYVRLFKAAFKDGVISSQHMLKALAQFTGSIQSYNSKYDKVKRGEDSFTVSEKMGYKTFLDKCNTCHKEPLFTDNSFRNNGLNINEQAPDRGRVSITGNPADLYKFKVPSLRNCSITMPYMHDGRMFSLGKVIDHYRKGMDTTQATIDTLLKKRLIISNQERVDLVAFLSSLKDQDMLRNPRFFQPDYIPPPPSHDH